MSYHTKAATMDQMEGILDLQVEAFLNREPMTMALGMDEQSYRESMRWMFEKAVERGSLFVAVEDGTDLVVGLGAYYPSNILEIEAPPESIVKGHEEAYAASGALFDRIDKKLADIPAFREGKCIHAYYLATHKDFARCGIASAIDECAMAYAKEQGYTHVYGEATNIKSLNIFLKKGGVVIDRVEYAKCGIPLFENTEGELVLFTCEI
ncbi:MAG: hypothetical protein RR547_11445 [Raoultibacter sp.]